MSTVYYRLTYNISPEEGYETLYCADFVSLISLAHERSPGEFFVNVYEGDCPEPFTSPTALHFMRV